MCLDLFRLRQISPNQIWNCLSKMVSIRLPKQEPIGFQSRLAGNWILVDSLNAIQTQSTRFALLARCSSETVVNLRHKHRAHSLLFHHMWPTSPHWSLQKTSMERNQKTVKAGRGIPPSSCDLIPGAAHYRSYEWPWLSYNHSST